MGWCPGGSKTELPLSSLVLSGHISLLPSLNAGHISTASQRSSPKLWCPKFLLRLHHVGIAHVGNLSLQVDLKSQ